MAQASSQLGMSSRWAEARRGWLASPVRTDAFVRHPHVSDGMVVVDRDEEGNYTCPLECFSLLNVRYLELHAPWESLHVRASFGRTNLTVVNTTWDPRRAAWYADYYGAPPGCIPLDGYGSVRPDVGPVHVGRSLVVEVDAMFDEGPACGATHDLKLVLHGDAMPPDMEEPQHLLTVPDKIPLAHPLVETIAPGKRTWAHDCDKIHRVFVDRGAWARGARFVYGPNDTPIPDPDVRDDYVVFTLPPRMVSWDSVRLAHPVAEPLTIVLERLNWVMNGGLGHTTMFG